MNACLLLAGAKQLLVAGSTFTLAWTQPVEKTQWAEDWQVGLSGFQLVETRVDPGVDPGAESGAGGSSAAIEPPDGAVFDGKVWRYHPALAFLQDRLILTRSGMAGGGWQICDKDNCQSLSEIGAGEPAILVPCP